MTSEKLDTLSDEGLYNLADKLGLDLPAGLDRPFIIEELLHALEEESLERRGAAETPLHVEEKKFSCHEEDLANDPLPALENHYNETMIRAIARDPAWAFAYWDISDADLALLRSDTAEAKLFLRVTELRAEAAGRKSHFDIPVSEEDFQWYVNLPRSTTRYRIDLCMKHGTAGAKTKVLAHSDEVAVPRHYLEEELARLEPEAAALLRLSGLESLNIEPPHHENPQRILSHEHEGE